MIRHRFRLLERLPANIFGSDRSLVRIQAPRPVRHAQDSRSALDLASLPESAHPAEFQIERVDDARSLERWLQAYVEGFGMAEAAARPFFDLYLAIGFDASSPVRHYVGTLNGETVASSTLFLGAGVASIWHVGTAPGARRRGVGTAMTLAPLLDARDLCLRAGVLGSSESGLSIYEKLGFQTSGRIVQYRWTPKT